MNLIDFAELGATIVAIIALVVITKEFLKHSKNRDDNFTRFLERQENNFTEVVKNHLTHSNKTNEELKSSNLQLKNVIERLLDFLKKR